MKIKFFIISCYILLSSLAQANTYGWNFQNNRIAISADGNNEPDIHHFWQTADPDDWGATPASLAIIAKLKRQNNLVHFSYNNFMNSPPHYSVPNEMDIGVQGAITYWNYNASTFFDVSANYEISLNHLVKVIEVSTKENPLYFIHMGPSEFFYRAIERVIQRGKKESLSHLYVISHSGYNDTHLRRGDAKYDKSPVPEKLKHHTLKQAIELSGNKINYKRIKDQNGEWSPTLLWHSKHDWSVWQWMKNHEDKSIGWIYDRMKKHPKGVADFSDAGMVYFLLTGDENGSPEKFRKLIGSGIN